MIFCVLSTEFKTDSSTFFRRSQCSAKEMEGMCSEIKKYNNTPEKMSPITVKIKATPSILVFNVSSPSFHSLCNRASEVALSNMGANSVKAFTIFSKILKMSVSNFSGKIIKNLKGIAAICQRCFSVQIALPLESLLTGTQPPYESLHNCIPGNLLSELRRFGSPSKDVIMILNVNDLALNLSMPC